MIKIEIRKSIEIGFYSIYSFDGVNCATGSTLDLNPYVRFNLPADMPLLTKQLFVWRVQRKFHWIIVVALWRWQMLIWIIKSIYFKKAVYGILPEFELTPMHATRIDGK